MKPTDELRLLATKYDGGGLDGCTLAERLREVANDIETDAILFLAEEALRANARARRPLEYRTEIVSV